MHEVEGRIAVLDHPENLISALTIEGQICVMSTWDLSCGTLSNFPIAAHSSFTFSLISPKLSILVESCWFSLLASQINYFLTSKESYLGPNPSFSEVLLALYLAKAKAKLLSHVRLFVTPWTVAYQAPLSMGFSRQ